VRSTTGVITGENFHFVSNTGIANLKGDPEKLESIHNAVMALNW